MIPLSWLPKLLGALVLLVFLGWGSLALSRHLGTLEGQRDAAKAQAKRERALRLDERAHTKVVVLAQRDTIKQLRAKAVQSNRGVAIVAPDSVQIEGQPQPTWTHPSVVTALADCRAVMDRVPILIGAVEADGIAADNALAADSAVILAEEIDNPGWLARTWEKVDGPVYFVGGLLLGAVVGSLAGG